MNKANICNSHRSLWCLTGSRQWCSATIRKALHGFENDSLIISDRETISENIEVITYKKARNFLGQERKAVVFEITPEIQPDALAAVTGLVMGGGCLILSLPAVSEWDQIFVTNFSKRFISFIRQSPFVNYVDSGIDSIHQSLTAIKLHNDFVLTADQNKVVEQIISLIKSDQKGSLVVVSDRGRGKSTSLGVLSANLLTTQTIEILITAPRFKACEVAFSTIQKQLNNIAIQQAGIRYQNSEIRFMAPDEIIRSDANADLLLIDEAASIPLPLLKQLLERFNKTVFVSTVHGYEGTGRGFAIRFLKELNVTTPNWGKVEMKTPVRWADNDPLENWIFKLLCLDADVMTTSVMSADVENIIAIENLKIKQLKKTDLLTNEELLRQIFALLVLAHYKTRPSDLQRLLDDDVLITIAMAEDKVVAVLLSADEGGLSAELSTAIYQGVRRPKGNLLAQTLAYHCGVENAASAKSHRVQRIVVQPQYQGLGIGSLLLEKLVTYLETTEVDILGASFGLTEELANFWQKNQFSLVRIGLKKEQSSGEHAAVYLHPFTAAGEYIFDKARERFVHHLPLLQKYLLNDVETQYLEIQTLADSNQLSVTEQEDIESFVQYSRAYELCIAGVKKWAELNLSTIKSVADDVSYNVVINVIENNLGWKAIANTMHLEGKKQAQILFKKAVIDAWGKSLSC